MKRSRYAEPQIVFALQQAEAGTPVVEASRKMGTADAASRGWKKRCGRSAVWDIRRLRELEQEAARPQDLVADMRLDKAVLRDVLRKTD